MQVNPPVPALPRTATTTPLESPGFGEYFGILRKRRRLLMLVAGPIIGVGAALALLLPDVYRSAGLIEIEGQQGPRATGQSQSNLQSVVARDSDEPMYPDQYVESLGTVVLSDKNLKKLLAEHRLYDGQDKDIPAAVDQLRSDIKVNIVTTGILDPESGREREVVTAFSVGYENLDPHRSREGASWLVDSYLKQNRLDREQYASGAAKFYASEAERIRKQVTELEARLADFKQKNVGRLPELNQANVSTMDRTENEIQNVETQMQALRRERVFLMAQLQQARASGPETGNLRLIEEEYKRRSVTYDEGHPDMIAMRRQMDALRAGGSTTGMSLSAQLQTQRSILAEARQRYSEDHPDVKRIMRNIESLQARIAAGETADRSVAADSPMAVQLQTQLNATDTQLGALQVRATELRGKLSELEDRMSTAPQVERDLQIVSRDLASARAKYDELVKRQMDAEVSAAAIAGGSADKFQVKSAPSTPKKPAKPQRIALIIIAAVLGAIAGLSAIVVAQLLDPTVRGVRDIREILEVTPLSAVPVIRHSRRQRRRRFRRALANPGTA
jgi:polysaccharide biosynthesis transport protein